MTAMKQHSEVAWEIASRYSSVLASETRDLAAAIDKALEDSRRNLATRDDFIVNKGLWSEFTDGLNQQIMPEGK